MSNPFDYLNSVNMTKKDIMDPLEESKYPAFMVNRGLSYFQDTVLLANEMNRSHQLDGRMQYDFLRTSIRKRKRFSKWVKKDAVDNVALVKEYYNYSDSKAESVMDLFTSEDIAAIKSKLYKGGKR
jgi:hypothetical protein|tara:strand:- start:4099 stop:4476 length:378 start_codon:yes stop_codon:yes gene_type:complete